jgi:hypothetical protein
MNQHAMQIAMILDRSGSMSSIQEATVEGMNAFLADQKQSPAETFLLLVQFDNVYEQLYSGPIANAPSFTLAEHPIGNQIRFEPRGMTALLDAMGKTIDDLGRSLAAMPEDQRPEKVVVVTMTDGLENKSTLYSEDRIADLIRHQREVYRWEFQFLAANQDAIATAGRMNIPAAQAITYTASGSGMRNVMASMSRSVRSYAAAPGVAASPVFNPADRAAAMAADPEPADPAKAPASQA